MTDRHSNMMVGLVLIVVVLVGMLAFVLDQPSASGNAEVASTPAACAAHKWVNQANESAAGAINYACAQPAYSDLSGTNQPTWSNIQSFPAGCAQFSFVGTIAAAPTCNGFALRTTQDRASTNATFHLIPGLSFTTTANTNYVVSFMIQTVQASTNPGTISQIAVSALPAGATLQVFCDAMSDATLISVGSSCVTSATTAAQSCGEISATDPCVHLGWFTFTTGATTGVVGVDYRRSAGSGANAATVKSGSALFVSVVP